MKQLTSLFSKITLVISFIVLASCGSSGGSISGPDTNLTSTQKSFVENYADIVLASYDDSFEAAVNLRAKIDAFVANPTLANFNAAKTAWLESREPYGQTEMTRFFDSPIDGDDGLPEYQMNAWPLDEAYIDYVAGDANAGLVNDTSFTLTKENLINENGVNGDDAVTTGYHAIEFLLWGQDQSTVTAGVRPVSDFVSAPNSDRRKLYLSLVADILVDHLQQVTDEWKENAAYRTGLVSGIDTKEAIRRIILGVGSLAGAELGGERMRNAMESVDQEDEHSCFSDNTHRDLVTDLQGIVNVYNGRYTRTDGSIVGDGTGLSDVIAGVSPELNNTLIADLNVAITAINQISTRASIDNVHFDQQISVANSADRDNIQTAIDSLQSFSVHIAEAAAELGININLE